MNNENSNCCDTDNSGCDTKESDCCSTDANSTNSNTKKKVGLTVLLIAVVFAVLSAFNTGNSSEVSSCSPGQESCATSCETGGDTKTSCCSIK